MANRDTLLLAKLLAEIARQRRTDQRRDRMLAVVEHQHALYSAGYDYADAPTPEKATELEGVALSLAAAVMRLASDGCNLFRFDPKAKKELANAD